jgi:DNA-binding protein H-NS
MATKTDNIEITVSELDQQIEKLQAQRKELVKKERKDDLEKIISLIRRHDFSEDDLGLTKQRKEGKKPGRSKVAQKFFNPDNPRMTWSGRGREPNWYKENIAKGKTKENMLIDKAK